MAKKQNRALKMRSLTFRTGDPAAEGGRKIGYFSGYLSVWGVRDSYGTAFVRGAFTKSLSEHETFPLLADHMDFRPIGKFTAKEDDIGLRIDAEIYLDIQAGMEKWILLSREAIDGLSVGFKAIKEQYDSTRDVTDLLEVKLYEGSVVTFPSNEAALVDQLRALGGDERKALAPALEAAASLAESLTIFQKALTGDPEAQARGKSLAEDAIEKIGALKDRLQRSAAAPATPEPHPHSETKISEADVVELRKMMGDLNGALQTLSAV